MSYPKGFIEEKTFTQDFAHFHEKYPGMDEVHLWITKTLTENPRAGEALKQSPEYRTLVTQAYRDTPSFWVFYRVGEDNVTLLSIEPVS